MLFSGLKKPSIRQFSKGHDAAAEVIPAGSRDNHLVRKSREEIEIGVNPRIVSLTAGELLCKTLHGFRMVVPGWNVDVGIGIARDGIIEPWTNAVFQSLLKEGDNLINVGANFGYYSLLGAQTVGRTGKVFAVEANPVVFPFLVKSAFWSGYPDVIRMFNCAAASPDMHNKEIDFFFDPQYIGGGSLIKNGNPQVRDLADCFWNKDNIEETLDDNRQFGHFGVYSKVTAKCRTVDSLIPADTKINVMLIDAEGSECYVIAGAMETIRRNPDMSLIVEWSSHGYQTLADKRPIMEAMWDFLLDEMKYNIYRVCPENYPGLGAMPTLQQLTRQDLYTLPHSDVLIRR
jgi:FkbM family methyltransferase